MIDGENILKKAIRMTTGVRTKAGRTGSVRMKIKRMAAEDIEPDRWGEPSDTLKGDLLDTFNYAQGVVLEKYERGALLKVRDAKPQWFYKPNVRWAFKKAQIISNYFSATGKTSVPSITTLEKGAATAFRKAAASIEPDSDTKPSTREMGRFEKTLNYAGGLKLSIYARGILLAYDGKYGWFNIERKNDAFKKAKLLSGAAKAERVFKD